MESLKFFITRKSTVIFGYFSFSCFKTGVVRITSPIELSLIIRLSSIGDVILTTPILKQLKEKFPDITIDFLVMKNFKDSIEGVPYIDNLILFDKKENDGYQNMVAFGKKLAGNGYDYVFDLHSKIRSKIISKQIASSGAKVLVYPKRKWWKSLLVKMKLIKYHVDDLSLIHI